MHLINYISPSCRIIHVSVEGVMMQSPQNSSFSVSMDQYHTVEEDDNWI